MASLTWLHLSDLHAGRPQWDSGRVTETLIADFKRLAAEGLRGRTSCSSPAMRPEAGRKAPPWSRSTGSSISPRIS